MGPDPDAVASPSHHGSRQPVLLLDAFGTLLTMPSPARELRRGLAEAGHHFDDGVVESAMRAEIRHYKKHHLRGVDGPSLAALRRECASVLGRELGPDRPPLPRLTELLVDALRFELAPHAVEAVSALAGEGWRCAVVSNWDVSLSETLGRLGAAGWFDAVVTSASVGVAKPDPMIFRHALRVLGVEPREAIHCGDRPVEDIEGARRAGVLPVLVGEPLVVAPPGTARISTLAELPATARRLAYGPRRAASR